MIKEVREDIRSFMHEYKSIIYWTILLYLVDHFCFEGAFKVRLQQTAHNLIGKVEKKVEALSI